MYSAYLSYSQAKEYLDFLLKRNLLLYDQEKQLFKLTERGLRVLGICDEMDGMIALNESRLPSQ
jgi:predicted transcriptional regulator